jgi:hypothetical protein
MNLWLVDWGWGMEVAAALRSDTTVLRIISPFVKLRALERLLAQSPQSIQVITRYNLDDFAKGALGGYCISRMPEPLAGRLPVHA